MVTCSPYLNKDSLSTLACGFWLVAGGFSEMTEVSMTQRAECLFSSFGQKPLVAEKLISLLFSTEHDIDTSLPNSKDYHIVIVALTVKY